jgi:hypothetical protein
MAEELRASVERLTGAGVTAFMGDNHLESDMAVESSCSTLPGLAVARVRGLLRRRFLVPAPTLT